MVRRGVLALALSLAVGCGKDGAGAGDGADTGTTGADGETMESTGSITSPTTGATETEGDTDACGFVCSPDGGGGVKECDPFAQDCPDGEKCMPYADDGQAWNSTKCSPLDRNPKSIGDMCTAIGGAVSGEDDCEKGAMCWNVDPETNIGICTSLCEGSQANPMCPDLDDICSIYSDGALPICLRKCDPLLQDCPGTDLCLPTGTNDAFVCLLDANPTSGEYGEACAYLNVCDVGLLCIAAEAVPGCVSEYCCSEYCDIVDPNASMNCSGSDQGQACIAWFEDGNAPPEYTDVGYCGIP